MAGSPLGPKTFCNACGSFGLFHLHVGHLGDYDFFTLPSKVQPGCTLGEPDPIQKWLCAKIRENSKLASDPQLAQYPQKVKNIAQQFTWFEPDHVPSEENDRADILSRLGSSSKPGN
ncbi:hypothetical protein JHK86_042924 [Glycine max]|nr:hypothetical protein JHK86_042924 [Glycine max]